MVGERQISMSIRAFGLKTCYVFKETQIPTSQRRDHIHQVLKRSVAPAIRDLESDELINGFHYIIHRNIDLRLSCDDWGKDKSKIQNVLALHSIPTPLRDWELQPPESYGGETGVLLCYNNLEFNSRLCLAWLEIMKGTKEEAIRELCPHQWVHYLFNQAGYLNLDQIQFELNDGFKWLKGAMQRSPGDSKLRGQVMEILRELEDKITDFTRKFKVNGS